ncbi:DNA alkylation repair protein [Georgenia sp. M64]|uniref:DNA alkylation repair protein n=1 Tax=Georgenia sp. M64 TaxID=3120520 RepID=UPI0030E2983B
MPFADELIGPGTARALRDAVRAAGASRVDGASAGPLDEAVHALGPLPLRARSDLLRDALLAEVPGDLATLAVTVRRAAGDPGFTGWLIWPVTTAVARRAIEDGAPAALDDALRLLAELTPRLTSEFALRPLLRHDLPRTLAAAARWTSDPDPHVRRLASEGTRPYLSWAVRVPALVAAPVTVPLLDALYRDESEMVRRSVANHLNDLSRHAPEVAVEVAGRWSAAPAPHTSAVVRHAMRTLVRRGDPGALALLGFGGAAAEVSGPVLDRTALARGETLTFTATVTNPGPGTARLSVDYVVHYRKADGTLRPKTFKLRQVVLDAGESVEVTRRHAFRDLSTRRHHPGEHRLGLLVNGRATDTADFTLT